MEMILASRSEKPGFVQHGWLSFCGPQVGLSRERVSPLPYFSDAVDVYLLRTIAHSCVRNLLLLDSEPSVNLSNDFVRRGSRIVHGNRNRSVSRKVVFRRGMHIELFARVITIRSQSSLG